MKINEARVLVTGGGTGIGRATAALLVNQGAQVAITGRDAKRLEAAAREIGAIAIQGDVTNESDVKRFVGEAIAKLGDLNVLVNNAGIGTFAPLLETNAADVRRVFETNTLGALLVGRECARHFVNRKSGPGGSIVNIGSTAAQRGFAGGSAYCASKFALTALTECWRAELRGSNVRVMQVNPSEVQNDFGVHAGRAGRAALNPSKLVSEDIAHVIVGLLELEDRGFVTDATVWATNPK
ncbi:MAG: SDR family oxidoreductase [Planctomycetota bacterium]|nr:SDR family oxidoreductase [Planctomycetota bacterium]